MLLLWLAAQAYLTWRRLFAYLRYFQQDGYDAVRFLRWVRIRSLADPAVWLVVAAGLCVGTAPTAAVWLFALGAVGLGWAQPDPRRGGKIPLRMTWRAWRVQIAAFVLSLVVWLMLMIVVPGDALRAGAVATVAVLVAMPVLLAIGDGLLGPYERGVQAGYRAEAVARLAEVRPLVIGITGSYGKSSSKSMLAHMLQFKAPTLAATGSVNTLMGLTRHIREELVPGHEFLVVEMGAYNVGSIRRLCRLTPPSAALITAVGDMHLERFGSAAAIEKAKGELAEALPADGLLVVNADSPGALRIARRTPGRRVLLYGETSTEDLDTRLEDVRFTSKGSSFVLRTSEKAHHCFTPLHGRPILLNLAGAFTLATACGIDPELAVASFRTLRPVSNRLEVVEDAGVTWIRDAYNSNQFGFRAALEVAAALPVTRRFLATPGVIELGGAQFEVNRALAREASAVCVTTLVVGGTNREAFVAGFRDAGREDRLVAVPGRAEAFRWLRDAMAPGDLVVLENDLPDLYERSAGLFWKAS